MFTCPVYRVAGLTCSCVHLPGICAELPAAALRDVDHDDGVPKTDDFGAQDYRKILELKTDHASRPLWIVRRSCCCLTFFQSDCLVRVFDSHEHQHVTVHEKSIGILVTSDEDGVTG